MPYPPTDLTLKSRNVASVAYTHEESSCYTYAAAAAATMPVPLKKRKQQRSAAVVLLSTVYLARSM